MKQLRTFLSIITMLGVIYLLSGCADLSARIDRLTGRDVAQSLPADALATTGSTELGRPTKSPLIQIGSIENYSLIPDAEYQPFQVADPSEGENPLSSEELLEQLLLAGKDQAPSLDGGEMPEMVEEKVTFDIPMVENEKVQFYLDYYTGNGKKFFSRWLERSARYLPTIEKVFAEEGLPLDLAYLAMIESGFNFKAYSWAHAVGPWQFIESTGRMFGLDNNWWYDERRDLEKSTRAAARYLKRLSKRFDDDLYLAIASYNAGPGKISRAIKKYKTRDFWEISRGSYLRKETKYYVPKLIAALMIAKEPAKYGFTDLDYMEPISYDIVEIPSTTDLEIVAKFCNVSYDEIRNLNNQLKRWCTPPNVKNFTLKIPAGSKEIFLSKYNSLNPAERANYKRHRLKSGDTLRALALKYDIRTDDIIALNGIKNPRTLQIGDDIILPLRKGTSSRPIQALKDDHIKSRRHIYTVRSGDSLWSISQRFGVSEYQLRVWNRLGWSNVIRPGQVLYVSARGAKKSKTAKRVVPKKPAGPKSQISYMVREGDTLWDISKRYQVNTGDIQQWNNLTDNHILQPGEILTLHVVAKQNA